MNTVTSHGTSPGSAQEALAMLRSAMSHLSSADATQLAAETQAQCLLGLEQLDAIETAARVHPGCVHRRARVFGGRGLQPAGVAGHYLKP